MRLDVVVPLALLLAVAVFAACGGDDDEGAAPGPRPQTEGRAADAAEATRVVEIKMLDELGFEPAQVEVATGEVVTFRVTNVGKLPHELTIGGAAAQDLHRAEMLAAEASPDTASGEDHAAMGHGSPASAKVVPSRKELAELDKKAFKAVHVMPRETKDVSWAFTGEAPMLGCQVPGHWDAGRRGLVRFA